MIFSAFLKGFREGFKELNLIIAGLINFILLALVYFLGVGLTFIAAKLFRRHFLALKRPKAAASYWLDFNLTKESKENYYRQF